MVRMAESCSAASGAQNNCLRTMFTSEQCKSFNEPGPAHARTHARTRRRPDLIGAGSRSVTIVFVSRLLGRQD